MKVATFCTGGLCNCLDSLIVGRFLSKKLGLPLWVYWVEGYVAMDARLDDILDLVGTEAGDVRLLSGGEFLDVCKHDVGEMAVLSGELEELHLNPATPVRHSVKDFGSTGELVNFCRSHNGVFLCTSEIPTYMASNIGEITELFDTFFERFRIKQAHADAVNQFRQETGVGAVGMHVRGTDIMCRYTCTLADVKDFVYSVKELASDTMLFLCSDDKTIEDTFANDEQIALYRNKEYVVKRTDDLSWEHHAGLKHMCDDVPIFEHGGKVYKDYASSNVVRTTKQVVGGWIDLITLASMQNVCGFVTSNESTYYNMALLLNTYFKARRSAVPERCCAPPPRPARPNGLLSWASWLVGAVQAAVWSASRAYKDSVVLGAGTNNATATTCFAGSTGTRLAT